MRTGIEWGKVRQRIKRKKGNGFANWVAGSNLFGSKGRRLWAWEVPVQRRNHEQPTLIKATGIAMDLYEECFRKHKQSGCADDGSRSVECLGAIQKRVTLHNEPLIRRPLDNEQLSKSCRPLHRISRVNTLWKAWRLLGVSRTGLSLEIHSRYMCVHALFSKCTYVCLFVSKLSALLAARIKNLLRR